MSGATMNAWAMTRKAVVQRIGSIHREGSDEADACKAGACEADACEKNERAVNGQLAAPSQPCRLTTQRW